MERRVRWFFEMGRRIVSWGKAHLDAGQAFLTKVEQLEALLERVKVLMVQQVNGKTAVTAAVRLRNEIVERIKAEPLRHLARIAKAAAAKQPGVDQHFRLPRTGISRQAFLNLARNMAAEAENHLALFQEYGMTPESLQGLRTSLAEYDAAQQAGDAGHRAHTGARADLEAVTRQIVQLVRDLDAMQRYRYRNEPEQLASWVSAMNIPWPNGQTEAGAGGTPGPNSGSGGVGGGEGGITVKADQEKPAA